ncbi:MAG: heparinase II/III domain-containing protein, partial [Gammaproteobacteria bacterium]
LGVRVRSRDQVTEVYLNLQADGRHANSSNTIAGWETDAYLFGLTRPAAAGIASLENVTRYFVSAGSYLRRGGRVVLDSVSKVDALFRTGAEIDLHLNGQDTIDLALSAGAKPARINVNGKPTPFRFSPEQKLARFRVQASRSI